MNLAEKAHGIQTLLYICMSTWRLFLERRKKNLTKTDTYIHIEYWFTKIPKTYMNIYLSRSRLEAAIENLELSKDI